MAKSKPGQRTKKRKYYTFKFTLEDYSDVFFDIGAFSIKELYFLAWKSHGHLKMTKPRRWTYFTARKPDNAPEKDPSSSIREMS